MARDHFATYLNDHLAGATGAGEEAPELQVADYQDLIRRAEDQRSRVETARLEAARRTLA